MNTYLRLTLTICLIIIVSTSTSYAEINDDVNGVNITKKSNRTFSKSQRDALRKKAEQGDANAQGALGAMYSQGVGVPVDYKKAIRWFKLSAEQGNRYAQNDLANMYVNGLGTSVNYKEAVKLFKLSAEQGDAIAQRALGVLYLKGQGVKVDNKEAVKWLKLSAKQGNVMAQSLLNEVLEANKTLEKTKQLSKDIYNIPYVKKWEEMRTNNKEGELIKEILFLKSPKKVSDSLMWLRVIILEKSETDYTYPFLYAAQLHRINYSSSSDSLKLTALTMVQYAKLLLLIDAKRCDDHGVGSTRMFNLKKKIEPIIKATKNLSSDSKKRAMNIALDLENTNKNRKKQPDICKSGMGYMRRAIKSKKTKTEHYIAKEGNSYGDIPGSNVGIVTTSDDVEVFYIPDSEWHKKREKLRKGLRIAIKDIK